MPEGIAPSDRGGRHAVPHVHRGERSFVLGDRTPDPELRQVDEDTFVLLRSFCYRPARGDPDEGAVYLVPGEDFEPPVQRDTRVVVPPDAFGRTDLASCSQSHSC